MARIVIFSALFIYIDIQEYRSLMSSSPYRSVSAEIENGNLAMVLATSIQYIGYKGLRQVYLYRVQSIGVFCFVYTGPVVRRTRSMTKYCSVQNCDSNDFTSPTFTLYKVRKDWKNLNCWKNVPNLICAKHFKENSYSSGKYLKKTAYPSLYLSSPGPGAWNQIGREHNYCSPGTQILKRRLVPLN